MYLKQTIFNKKWATLLTSENIFICTALIFGLFIITILPPMWGADETSHTARVYQLSQGHLKASIDERGMYGGYIPYNMALLTRFVYQDFHNDMLTEERIYSLTDHSQVDDSNIYRAYEREKLDGRTSPAQFTGAAAYSPLAYLGQLPGVWLARVMNLNIGTMITLGRVGGLLLYVVIIYFAIRILRSRAEKWIIFIVALFPMSLFQASIITADSLVIALALLAFACCVQLYDNSRVQKSTHLLTVLFIVCSILIHIKPTYVFLLLPVLLLPTKLWSTHKRSLYYKIGITLSALLLMGLWAYTTRDVNAASAMSNNQSYADQINTARQLKSVLLHPIGFGMDILRTVLEDYNHFMVGGIFGLLGFTYVAVPAISVVLLVAALTFASTLSPSATSSTKKSSAISAGGMLSAGLLCVIAIFVLFYLTFTPVSFRTVMGVQGRYFIPPLAFMLFGFGKLLPVKSYMSQITARIFFPVISVSVLLISLSYYYKVLY